MNNAELKKIIEDHLHWINEDCEGWQNLKADLFGADLRGANLREADLCEVDLRWADLFKADLRGVDLFKADLRGVDLRGADLRGANLREADLCEVDLRGADLFKADLRGANLRGAKLDYSCLPLWWGSEANFDSRQLKQIAYHLVKAGLQSSNATDADRKELGKLIDYANEFHHAYEWGEIPFVD